MSSDLVPPEAVAAPPPQAATPCQRCGTFAELRPSAGLLLCGPCIARLHPVEREPLTAGAVIAGVWHVLMRIGLPASVIVVLFQVPIAVLQILLPELPSMVSTGYGVAVTVIGNAAVMIMAHAVVTGEGPTDAMAAIRQALTRWMALATTQFLATILTAIGFVLCIVPGIIAALGLAVVLPIAIHEGGNGTDALKTSWEHMKGRLGMAFGVFAVWGAPLILLGIVPIMVIAVMVALQDPTYQQQPTSHPLWIVISVLSFITPILSLPTVIIPAVLYPKLRVAVNARRLSGAFAQGHSP